MTFTIQSYIAQDGERFSLLLDRENNSLPCFYPSAFISRHIRSRSTHETQKAYLNSIRKLLEWAKVRNINIEDRILSQKFISVDELDDLANNLRLKIGSKTGEVISQIKFNTHISYVTKYINWLVYELLVNPDNENVDNFISRLQNVLSSQVSKKTGSKTARAQQILGKRLTDQMEVVLSNLFADPFQNLLRGTDRGSRLRNVLMLRILYETGMRRGELLALKLKNYKEGTAGDPPSLVIERNHHDEFDTRINQPVAKTNGRLLLISSELNGMIKRYLYDYRGELPLVGFDDEDFIFVNHRTGPKQGQPLTISSFDSAMDDLRGKFTALNGLHPHLLRHHWNWRFSQIARADGYTDASDMLDRCYLMGWAHNSESAKIYNLKFIMEDANRKGLLMNTDTARGKKSS